MNNVTILNNSEFITPSSVQQAIRDRFSFAKNKEVNVKYDNKELSYDVYQDDKYICSFDKDGNGI
jgi:hypothetical protein